MDLPSAAPSSSARPEKVIVAGTHRACRPSETLARVKPYFADMGITRVANVTGMDHVGIPTVMVMRPNARSLSVSQGKGADLDSARASGVMEAVEHWHAERVANPLILASGNELPRGKSALAIERLPRSVRAWDSHLRTLWTEGRDLMSGRSLLAPFEMVHLDLRLPMPEASGCFPVGSNGLASGNNVMEATLHALWELIERDATTLFFQQKAPEQWQRRIDLSSVDDETCRALLDRYERAGIEIAVWDAASDLGIPCFLCAALDRVFNPFRGVGLARGSGCHNDARVALSRALTEAAQSRLTRIVGARDDLQREEVARLQSETENARHRLQMHTPHRPPRRFSEVPGRTFRHFEADLEFCLGQLSGRGFDQAVIVDLSRDEYPVAVVRAIIPGLEGISGIPGYVPGPRARAIAGGETS